MRKLLSILLIAVVLLSTGCTTKQETTKEPKEDTTRNAINSRLVSDYFASRDPVRSEAPYQ